MGYVASMNAVSRFFVGFRAPFLGIGAISRQRGTWGLTIVPVMILLVLVAVWISLSGSVLALMEDVAARYVPASPDGDGSFVRDAAALLGFGVLMGAGLVGSWFLAGGLASPFYDMLATRIERHELGAPLDEDTSWMATVFRLPLELLGSVVTLALFLAISVGLFILGFIPGLQLVTVPLSILVGSFFLAREVSDYALSHAGYGYVGRFAFLREYWAGALGLGAGCLVMFLIPCGGFLLMPAAVAGATAWVCSLPLDSAS